MEGAPGGKSQFLLQLSCTVSVFYKKTTFFFQRALSTSQTSMFFSPICRKLLRSEGLPALPMPSFHIKKSEHGKPVTLTGHHTQGSCHSARVLLLHYCLLLILPPYPGAVKPNLNVVLGFVSWQWWLLKALPHFKCIMTCLKHLALPYLSSRTRIKWEWMRISQISATQTKQGSLRETELLAWTPRSQAFLHLSPHPTPSAMLGTCPVISNHSQHKGQLPRRVTYTVQGESQVHPLEEQSWCLDIVGDF